MVGKYVELTESYKSLIEALRHAGIHNHTREVKALTNLKTIIDKIRLIKNKK